MSDLKIQFKSNSLDRIEVSPLDAKFSANGTRILRYYISFYHRDLNQHKELSATDISILQTKVDSLMVAWDQKYFAHETRKFGLRGKALAEEMVHLAEMQRMALRNILKDTISRDDTVDWSILANSPPFEVKQFLPKSPERPVYDEMPLAPSIGFFDRLFGGAKKKQHSFASQCYYVEEQNKRRRAAYEEAYQNWQANSDAFYAEQERERQSYNKSVKKNKLRVEQLRSDWIAGAPEAIVEHASLVLDASVYPEQIQKDYELAYNEANGTLLVDYQLPDPNTLPRLKTARFSASTGEIKQTEITTKESRELFDEVCYQICLRTIHELFEADTPGHLKAIAFNGVVRSVDRSKGKDIESVIMSIHVNREEFLAINLDRIEPRLCFKSLKGIAASSLSGLAPVAPIIRMNKNDRRIIEGRNVAIDDHGATNLAAMDWEEFEHFVRELFEREFASRGGEVKVTQSSSDGGVDAIAYDPDPITGGKIVIQAKRYTTTVGVSAVRDLYGTTLSEGASRGILVTTSDYGPDAYKFCSDKPITLLSGSNLLHLLEKHGLKAKIDLKAARRDLGLTRA